MRDWLRKFTEPEFFLTFQGLEKNNQVVLAPLFVSRLEVACKLIPGDILCQLTRFLGAQQRLNLNPLKDSP